MLSGGIRALLSEPPAEQSSTDLGSCGSPVAEATERGTERDWSPIQGALRSNRRANPIGGSGNTTQDPELGKELPSGVVQQTHQKLVAGGLGPQSSIRHPGWVQLE
ncbi:hypothetical protein JEQ12_001951 [Ovis aries]|uniref:Uncharacterized protein n=1 Tax=Ovis aries TaxID=9940 RepID=A0A836AQP5_SHEEP|nr:hypothetical protein JEQ12_001951 [Ovis aries]